MRTRRLAWAAAALALLGLYLWEAGHRGLTAGSESRYAEISREMRVSGAWLMPRYYGMAHLHKPPVTYWLTALGLRLFGTNEFGARFFVVLASLLGVLATWALGRLVLGARGARLAAGILASSGLWLMMGQTLTTDMFLSAATACAYWALLKAERCAAPRPYALLFWACLGLSCLIKAQAGILVIAIPVALWARWGRAGAQPLWARLRAWPDGVLVFALAAIPWYLAVIARDRSLLGYWIVDHVFARFFAEGKFQRGGPVWYFLPILAAGFLPWTLWLAPAARRAYRSREPEALLLLLWLAVPLLVFSVSRSKLPAYILPLLPAAALLVAREWEAREEAGEAPELGRRGAWALAVLPGLCAAALALGRGGLAPGVEAALAPVILAMGLSAGLALAASRAARRPGNAGLAFAGLALGTTMVLLCALEGSRRVEGPTASLRPLAPALRAVAAGGGVLVEYKVNTAAAPFYAGRLPLFWKEHIEVVLRDDLPGERAMALDHWDELQRAAAGAPLFVLTKRRDMPSLAREGPLGRLVAQSGPYVLLAMRAAR